MVQALNGRPFWIFSLTIASVLAMLRFATIESTKGSVIFELKNGKEERTLSRKKREVGTLATFDIKMSEEEFNDVSFKTWREIIIFIPPMI